MEKPFDPYALIGVGASRAIPNVRLDDPVFRPDKLDSNSATTATATAALATSTTQILNQFESSVVADDMIPADERNSYENLLNARISPQELAFIEQVSSNPSIDLKEAAKLATGSPNNFNKIWNKKVVRREIYRRWQQNSKAAGFRPEIVIAWMMKYTEIAMGERFAVETVIDGNGVEVTTKSKRVNFGAAQRMIDQMAKVLGLTEGGEEVKKLKEEVETLRRETANNRLSLSAVLPLLMQGNRMLDEHMGGRSDSGGCQQTVVVRDSVNDDVADNVKAQGQSNQQDQPSQGFSLQAFLKNHKLSD